MADLTFLEKFAKGDTDKMKRYINIYRKVAPGTFQAMQQNIIERDWERLRINAHSLKPQSDYMGIPALKALLVQIENSAAEGQAETLQSLYDKALQIHTAAETELKAFCEKV